MPTNASDIGIIPVKRWGDLVAKQIGKAKCKCAYKLLHTKPASDNSK
jgi:hypothetical protein